MRWTVRVNCEYSTGIEADTEEDAIKQGEQLDIAEWDCAAWSEHTAEPEGGGA